MSENGGQSHTAIDSGERMKSSTIIQDRIMDIHTALSNSDSLRIFSLAAEGIDASTSVLQRYQFTKKRYYGRLKELVDLGLIKKDNGEYKLTALGNAIYETQVKSLEQILLGKLTTSNAIPENEKFAVDKENAITNLRAEAGVRADLKPMRFFSTWAELAAQFSSFINDMKSEVYIATRYADYRISESALSAASRGCKVNMLYSSRNGLSPKLQIMGNLVSHPEALDIYKEFATNQNVKIAEETIPYSFFVVDLSKVGVEFVDPRDPYSFFFGVEFENPELAGKLIERFSEISKNAQRDTVTSVVSERRTPTGDAGLCNDTFLSQ